jgi:hypothetical protein
MERYTNPMLQSAKSELSPRLRLHPVSPLNVYDDSSCYAAGAAMGAATCTDGRCRVTKCKPAYHLVEGTCIRKKARAFPSKHQ